MVGKVLVELLIGFITGLLAALLMAAISILTSIGWGDQFLKGFPSQAPFVLQLLIPISCGLAIGLLRRAGAEPLPELLETFAQLDPKQDPKLQLQIQPKLSHILLGLLALLGGGSIGPEALLSRSITEWQLWLQRLKTRFAIGGRLARGYWSWLPGLIGGFAGFALLKGFDRFGSGEQGVIFLWPNSFSQGAWNLAWALLLGAGGGCLGLLFLLLRRQLVKQIKRCQASPLPLAIFTGVVLALVNIWQPLALFSGEQQLSPLLQGELVNRADQLLLMGFLKIALCALCLSTGWMGGIFFPLIIGAAAIGQGLHQAAGIIPGEVAISALVAGIQAMVLAQPWVPFVITVVVLKGHALPAAAIGSLVGWRLCRYVRDI